jgi:hypothetical protein
MSDPEPNPTDDAELRRLYRQATRSRSADARVRALELVGKHLGLFQEREPLDVFLNRLPPELAEPLRAALGRAHSTHKTEATAERSVLHFYTVKEA